MANNFNIELPKSFDFQMQNQQQQQQQQQQKSLYSFHSKMDLEPSQSDLFDMEFMSNPWILVPTGPFEQEPQSHIIPSGGGLDSYLPELDVSQMTFEQDWSEDYLMESEFGMDLEHNFGSQLGSAIAPHLGLESQHDFSCPPVDKNLNLQHFQASNYVTETTNLPLCFDYSSTFISPRDLHSSVSDIRSGLSPSFSSPSSNPTTDLTASSVASSIISSASKPYLEDVPLPRHKFTCLTCSHGFDNQGVLRRHQKSHDKPIHCMVPSCGFRCAERRDLNRHMSTAQHSDYRKIISQTSEPIGRYFCDVRDCNYSAGSGFGRKDNLKRHLKIKHGQT